MPNFFVFVAPLSKKIRTLFSRKTFSCFLGKAKNHDMILLKRMNKRRVPHIRQLFHIYTVLNMTQTVVFSIALVLFLLSSIAVVDFALSSYKIEVPKVKGAYTEAVIGSPQLMNPLFSSLNDSDEDIVALVYSGLMRYDEKRSLVTDLAAGVDINEDKTIYTFALKEHVLWHDGELFDADDVMYTFDALQDADSNSPLLLAFQDVVVEKIDQYHIRFTLPQSYATFLSSLTVGILPEHIWSNIPHAQLRLANRNVNPTGTGPFKFKELFKDATGFIHRVELERFEDFYRSAPYLKEFAFEYFNDYDGPQGVISALREKKVDGVYFVPFELRDKIKRKHILLHTLQLPQYTALFFNLDHSFFAKQALRKALLQSLDRERIVADVLSNEARVIEGPVLEGFPGFRDDVEKTIFSIDDANAVLDGYYDRISADDYRSLLREEKISALIQVEKDRRSAEQSNADNISQASDTDNTADTSNTSTENIVDTTSDEQADSTEGVHDSNDTIDETAIAQAVDDELDRNLNPAQLFYRYPKGDEDKKNIFEIDILTVSRPEYTKVAELVAGYWQDVGIKVNISLVDAKDLSRQVLKDRSYDVLLYGVIVGNDPDQYPFWHSSQATYPGLNLSQYKSDTVDTLLKNIRETVDDNKRGELYEQLQQEIMTDVPAAFLYTPTYTYALSDKIHGFDTTRIARPFDRFSTITSWYIDTKKVWRFDN